MLSGIGHKLRVFPTLHLRASLGRYPRQTFFAGVILPIADDAFAI
jgi:hypothetical protein